MKFDWKNVSKATIIRMAVLLLALANQALAVFGKSPLPFDSDQLTQLISVIWTIGSAVVAGWKNNSFTPAAINADKVMRKEKAKQ